LDEENRSQYDRWRLCIDCNRIVWGTYDGPSTRKQRRRGKLITYTKWKDKYPRPERVPIVELPRHHFVDSVHLDEDANNTDEDSDEDEDSNEDYSED